MKLFKLMIFSVAMAAFLLTAGCTPGTSPSPQEPPASSAASSSSQASSQSSGVKADQAKEMSIRVYYPNEDGSRLIAVTKTIHPDQKTDKYTAAIQALMAGTSAKGQVNIIPKTAKLHSVHVHDGVASVDFSGELVKKFSGGSSGETMLVGSIVDTLTEFPDIQKVQILSDGKKVETIAGHMDTSEPLARMGKIIQ